MKNLILQVQVFSGEEKQYYGGKLFTRNENIYRESGISAKEYATRIKADYLCIDNCDYLPDHHPTFQRFKMFEMDEYDNIFYVDSDAIILNDCPNIFEIEYDDIAAVPDYDWSDIKNHDKLNNIRKFYKCENILPFCCGVFLTSVKWRTEHKDIFFKELKNLKRYHDQQILNHICKNEYYTPLSRDWGAWDKLDSKYIIHYGANNKKYFT